MVTKFQCLPLLLLFTLKCQLLDGFGGGDMNQGRSLQQSQDWNGLYDLVDVECEDEVKGNSPQSLQQTQDQCNQQDSYNPNLDGNCLDVEIFNPIPAPKGRYPYFVSLQQRLVEGNLDRYRHFCGGALITRDIILTAAHCIWSKGSTDFRDTGDGKGNGVLREGGIFIALGPYCRHQQGLQRIIAKDFFMNPKYNGYPYQSDDIILLKTETPFDYTGPFPDFESAQNFVYESNDYVVTAMGHGAQTLEEAKENKDNIDILGRQVVPLGLAFFQYLPEDQCDVEVKTVSQQLKIYPDKMVCFVSRAQDTCFGDSGSPVIVAGGDSSAAFGDPSQDVLIEQWPDFGCEGIKVQRAHQPTSQCQGKKKNESSFNCILHFIP
eukprot:TRINITY_DN4596_c0_g1_i2.p1 TRINITY_DN4596_c0_g1~~TRINITY_DN4596_c0_g1_i2.p1  ORF type:complete len:378 (-),score=52.42 TRINITY_DN4596_c0_g1_i2:130-1263(-)